MKLWYIRPSYLPDALLYRQHQSAHGLIHGIIAGKPRRGVTRFLRYGGFVFYMHYVTVIEMMRRGGRHESYVDRLWDQIPVLRRRFDYPLRADHVLRDIAIIRQKVDDPNSPHEINNASLPISAAGTELLADLRDLVLENRLPNDALTL